MLVLSKPMTSRRVMDLSSLALISMAKVSDIGVMASLAVFSVSSRAPAIIVVSSWVSSPPFPACEN